MISGIGEFRWKQGLWAVNSSLGILSLGSSFLFFFFFFAFPHICRGLKNGLPQRGSCGRDYETGELGTTQVLFEHGIVIISNCSTIDRWQVESHWGCGEDIKVQIG